MAKITVITKAFNPGEYIYPCVDSVLNQTFRDFEYVIIDNASSDGTKEVLEEYVRKDSRISLYRNEENNVGTLDAIEKYVTTEYFMILDHDDYLELDALEVLYNAAQKENLDMVFGRCEMVNAMGSPLSVAGVNYDIPCIDGTEIWKYFDMLHWQMRTFWGKLIRTSLLAYVDRDTLKKRLASKYAGDTVIITSMAFAAKSLGTVEDIIIHYRILEKSESRSYCRHRFLADWVMLDMARDLLKKQNGLTAKNEVFLFRVYHNAICDTLRMALNGDVADEEKMEVIREVVSKEHTKEMLEIFKIYFLEEKSSFLKNYGHAIMNFYLKHAENKVCHVLMYNWLTLLYGDGNLPEEEYVFIYEKRRAILLLLCLGQEEKAYSDMEKNECPERCPTLYLSLALQYEKNIKRMAGILLQVGKEKPGLYERAQNAIRILVEQNAILQGMGFSVLEMHPDIVAAVCAEEYEMAANRCMELLSMEKWQRNGGILELAITLAAILEDAEAFILLKKCSCEFYINEGKKEEAKVVLADLEEMCLGDEEVELLRNALK